MENAKSADCHSLSMYDFLHDVAECPLPIKQQYSPSDFTETWLMLSTNPLSEILNKTDELSTRLSFRYHMIYP